MHSVQVLRLLQITSIHQSFCMIYCIGPSNSISFFQSYCPPIFVQRSKLACNLQCQRKNKTIPSVIFLDSLTISIFHDMQQKLSLLPLLKRNSLHFLCSLLISSLNYPLSFSIVCYLSKTDTATNSILFTPIH